MITVQQINEFFNGDPGKLMRRIVDTPAGQGKVCAVASGNVRGTFRVQVAIKRNREWFGNENVDLAINYANAAALGWEE
jgi:hypothetical protein